MKRTRWQKYLAALLSVCMILSALPLYALSTIWAASFEAALFCGSISIAVRALPVSLSLPDHRKRKRLGQHRWRWVEGF